MTKGLLNPTASRSRSRSRRRGGMQGRQLKSIKNDHVTSGASKHSGGSTTRQRSRSRPRDVVTAKEAAAPVVDLSSLKSLRGNSSRGRKSKRGDSTAFTKTTVGTSDDERRRRRSAGRGDDGDVPVVSAKVKKGGSTKGDIHMNVVSKGDVTNSGNSTNNKQTKKRRSLSRSRVFRSRRAASPAAPVEDDNNYIQSTASRKSSLPTDQSIRSNQSRNSNEGAIVPYFPEERRDHDDTDVVVDNTYNGNSSRGSGNSAGSHPHDNNNNNNEQIRSCPHHPSIILQELIYNRWLVHHDTCPKCLKQDDYGRDGTRSTRSGNNRRKSLSKALIPFTRRNKRDSNKHPNNNNNNSNNNHHTDSPLSTGRNKSRPRSRSPFLRFRKTRLDRSRSSGGGDNDDSRSADSRSQQSFPSASSPPFPRSTSPPIHHRSRSNSPSHSFMDHHSNHNMVNSENNMHDDSDPVILNNSETAIVLREDNISVELNPHRQLRSSRSPSPVDSIHNDNQRRIESRSSWSRSPSPANSMGHQGHRRPGNNRSLPPGARMSSRSPSPNSIGGRSRNNSWSRSPSNNNRRGRIGFNGRPGSRSRPMNQRSPQRSWSRSPSPNRSRGPGPNNGRPRSRSRPMNPRSLSRGPRSSRSPSLDSLGRPRRPLNQARVSRGRRSRSPSIDSMGRPLSRPRGESWSRSPPPPRRRDSFDRPTNAPRGEGSPNSISGGRRHWSRSPSPDSHGNRLRGSTGRPMSRQRPIHQRAMSRGRKSRSPSLNSFGRPRSRPANQRSGMSRGRGSTSPQNSIGGRPRRKSFAQRPPQDRRRGPSVGRRSNRREGSISRSSSPQNSLGRPVPQQRRRSMRRGSPSSYNSMNSRSRSPYNSIGSRSRSPQNSMGRRRPRSRSSGSRSSWGSRSMEESNLDYFDDERGEVVLHRRDNQSRRPPVGSRKFESLDDSFGYERRSNSFDASLEKISDRRPPPHHRRLNSFDESFDRVSSPKQYGGRRASLNDSFDSLGRRPFDRIPDSSSYQRDSSFDRMRQRIDASRFDESFNSQDGSLHDRVDLTSRRSSTSTGMEWSDYSKVKSKSKKLSTILKDIEGSRGAGADRGAIISRRNTAAIDRSPSPPSGLHHRALSVQSQPRTNRRGRSSSVGPGAREDGQADNMSSIMKALTAIKASSRRPSQSSLQASGDEHASKMPDGNNPTGRMKSNKSMQELHTSSFPRVLSENSFTGPTGQTPQHHQSKYSHPDDNQRFPHTKHPEDMQSQMERPAVSRRTPPPPPPRRSITPQNTPRDQNFPQKDRSGPSTQHCPPMGRDVPADSNDWRQYQQLPPQDNAHMNEQQQVPPHHDENWRKYQQTPTQTGGIDEDWRNYQVGSQNNHPHQHSHENPGHLDDRRSSSVGRGGPGGDNIDSSQHRNKGNPDWMTYQVGNSHNDQSDNNGGRSVSSGRKGRSKMFGKVPDKHINEERHAGKTVKKMPFTDQFGDFGLYTGQVNDESRPHGKGSMKYDNGGEVYVVIQV